MKFDDRLMVFVIQVLYFVCFVAGFIVGMVIEHYYPQYLAWLF